MKYLKTYEGWSGRFASEPREEYEDGRDTEKIQARLEIGDHVEYFFQQWDYKTAKNVLIVEIGQIVTKRDPALDNDVVVIPTELKSKRGLLPNNKRPISSLDIMRKLPDEEIEANKYKI